MKGSLKGSMTRTMKSAMNSFMKGCSQGWMRNFLLSIQLLVAACTQSDSLLIPASESLRNEAVHALMAQRIDNLYRRIEVLALDQNRTLTELHEVRQRRSEEIIDTAQQLAEAAEELTALTDSVNITSANLRRFQNLSRDLRDRSNEVALAAGNSSSSDLASSIDNLQQTCSACHNLYRDR